MKCPFEEFALWLRQNGKLYNPNDGWSRDSWRNEMMRQFNAIQEE